MALEPVAGQVYFSPECHAAYAELGFSPSPGTLGGNVQLPDGPAYFTSRGSLLGQVPGQVVAAAFAVFNPEAVVPSVEFGWAKVDAPTICAARTRGAVAQLERVIGSEPDGLGRVTALLADAVAPLRPEGKPLFAGLLSLGLPGDLMGDMWRLADMLPRVPGRRPHGGLDLGRSRRHGDRPADRAVLGSVDAELCPHPRLVGPPTRRGGGAPGRSAAWWLTGR